MGLRGRDSQPRGLFVPRAEAARRRAQAQTAGASDTAACSELPADASAAVIALFCTSCGARRFNSMSGSWSTTVRSAVTTAHRLMFLGCASWQGRNDG